MTVTQVFEKWDKFSLSFVRSIASVFYELFGITNYTLAYIILGLYALAFCVTGFVRIMADNYAYQGMAIIFNLVSIWFLVKSIRYEKSRSERFYFPEEYTNSKMRFYRVFFFFLIPISIFSLALDYGSYTSSGCAEVRYYRLVSQMGFMCTSALFALVVMLISIRPFEQKRF